MSGKARLRKTDARVLRTHDSLGDALVALMHEKPFDSITVQEVLDRAAVGRSTFYSHFRGKDDLFLSDVEHFFELVSTMLTRCNDTSNRVAPVCELFSHIGDMRQFYAALVASGKIHDVTELGQAYLARSIEERPAALNARPMDKAHRIAVAHALSGALFSLLSWWIAHNMQPTPAEMDTLYHQMVWSGVCGQSVVMP
jgi:AcrR family transcriptional regulator